MMRLDLRGGALLSAALAVCGTASADSAAPKPAPAPCAFVRTIDNFSAIDNNSAILESGPGHRYKVTFVNSCYQLKWAEFARLEARPGVCLSKGDVLVVGKNGFVDRCFISSIELLPPKNTATPAGY